MRGSWIAAVSLLLGFASPCAVADVGPPMLRETAWHLVPGVTVGVAAREGVGLHAGPRLGVVRFLGGSSRCRGCWYGPSTEFTYDPRHRRTLGRAGVALGWMPFGLDVGALGVHDASGLRVGPSVGARVTVAVAALSLRVAHVDAPYGEVSLSLQRPVRLGKSRRE